MERCRPLDIQLSQSTARLIWRTAPARRVLVRSMTERGLSERRALAVVGMSPSALRYTPAPDRNATLRERIVALAHRHRRYGAGMIHLKLRQAGERANHKRVHRLYVAERLQIRRRRRKKVPVADRQPLVKPTTANEVWSADFVFDRTAEGRVLKCLAIVDDATTEAVAIVPARALGGIAITRVLDRLAMTRGLPRVLRTDNELEFCGRAMLTWAHERRVTLRLIEPGKPNQNAYVESFNGRFRDECLNEHWFTSLAHAEVVIEAWRREYNDERPKKGLSGLTPAAYGRRLMRESDRHQVRWGAMGLRLITRFHALKSWVAKAACGFDSRPRHQFPLDSEGSGHGVIGPRRRALVDWSRSLSLFVFEGAIGWHWSEISFVCWNTRAAGLGVACTKPVEARSEQRRNGAGNLPGLRTRRCGDDPRQARRRRRVGDNSTRVRCAVASGTPGQSERRGVLRVSGATQDHPL